MSKIKKVHKVSNTCSRGSQVPLQKKTPKMPAVKPPSVKGNSKDDK